MSARLPRCRVLHSNRQLPTFNYLLPNEGPIDLTQTFMLWNTLDVALPEHSKSLTTTDWCDASGQCLRNYEGKWKCKLHFSLERKTMKNVNSAVVTIMDWVQASFITQNGIHFLSHLMKSHYYNNSTRTVAWKRKKPTHSQWNCD